MAPEREAVLFGRGYWVSRGRRLLAGAYPGDADPSVAARKLDQLDALGIEHILSLMEPDETDHQGRQFHPYEQEWERRGHSVARLPVRDLAAPSPQHMLAILDHVDGELDKARGVLVHCWGGRGRTGTVVGCWLVRHAVATPALALTTLASLPHPARMLILSPPRQARNGAWSRAGSARSEASRGTMPAAQGVALDATKLP